MKNGYANGKIYAIRSNQTDAVYVGCTIQPLRKRLYAYRKRYKIRDITAEALAVFEIIKLDGHYIELLEAFPCDSRDELYARKGYHMRRLKCVNNRMGGGMNDDEHKEYIKEYARKNADKARERYERRKDELKVSIAEWAASNPNKIREYRLRRKNKRVKCECGRTVNYYHLGKHRISRNHKI